MVIYFCALKKKQTLACSRCCTEGLQKSVVCTVNTDVMVLVIAAFELWIAFGTGSFIIMIPQKEFVLLESRLPCYRL